MPKSYLVCWSERFEPTTIKGKIKYEDHYEVFADGASAENKKLANEKYNQLVGDDVYTANICEIIKSTDY